MRKAKDLVLNSIQYQSLPRGERAVLTVLTVLTVYLIPLHKFFTSYIKIRWSYSQQSIKDSCQKTGFGLRFTVDDNIIPAE